MIFPPTVTGPVELNPCWDAYLAKIGEQRGDEHLLHASDLGGCDFATAQRLAGKPQLPHDAETLERFRRGHSFEREALDSLFALGDDYNVSWGEEEIEPLVCHIDFTIYSRASGRAIAVVDVSTTASKDVSPSYGHTIKTAYYAMQREAPFVGEWVFSIGYGGLVKAREEHWYNTTDWETSVNERLGMLARIKSGFEPLPVPPTGEEWRCRGYCDALCYRNERLPEKQRAALEVPF